MDIPRKSRKVRRIIIRVIVVIITVVVITVITLGLSRLERGQRDDPRSLEPNYCRLSEAELARRRRPEGT